MEEITCKFCDKDFSKYPRATEERTWHEIDCDYKHAPAWFAHA